MVDSIKQARKELQDYADNLEEKVKERTKEVQEKMEEVQREMDIKGKNGTVLRLKKNTLMS